MGVYGISQGIRKVREFEDTLGDLALQGKKSNTWLDVGRKKILETSSKWGIMKDEVLGFTNTLVGYTGNLDEAVQLMDKMGMVATATRAPMQNLAGTVYQLQKNLGLSAAQTPQAMALMRQMEMEGKFTFSHFAQHGGRAFGGLTMAGKQWQGMSGLRGAGALLEFATSKYSAGQEGTSAEAVGGFLRDLWLKRKKLKKKIGLQVEGRDLPSVLKDLAEKMQTQTMSDKALNVFGEQGKIIATGLKGGYGQWGQTYGKVFGMKADPSLLMKQAAQKMEQPAQKWKKTMADLDAAMHRHLLPVMKDIVKLMPSVAKGLKWAMDNFKLLFGALVAFKASGAIRGLVQGMAASRLAGGAAGGGVYGHGGQVAAMYGAGAVAGARGAGAPPKVGAGQMLLAGASKLFLAAGLLQVAASLLPKKYRNTLGTTFENATNVALGVDKEDTFVNRLMEKAYRGSESGKVKTARLESGTVFDFGEMREAVTRLRGKDFTDPLAETLQKMKGRRAKFLEAKTDKKGRSQLTDKDNAALAKLETTIVKLEAALKAGIKLDPATVPKNRSDLRSGRKSD
jgi:hypothetical protein